MLHHTAPHTRTRTPTSVRALLTLALALLLNACGGGDNAGTPATPSSAAVPTKTIQAATTRLAVPITTPADPLLQGLAIPADAATRGMWGPVQTWPMNAIHMALLPDGRVLSYGAPANQDVQDGRSFSLWTPSLGFGTNAHATSFEAGRVNSFCSTATWLGDGRLLITGGNTPRGSHLFTGATPLATNDSAQLADDRWYATMLTLPDGRAVMLGGIDPYTEGMYQNPDQAIAAGQVSMTPELYTPGTGWRSLTGASSRLAFGPDNLRASYPRAWVAPNGEVFGISADQMWWLDVAGNNGSGALRSAGVFKGGPSNATPRNVGATNSAVMFAPGRILQLGGNGGFNGDGFVASDAATVIDINSGAPVLTETARLSAPRRFPSATVLADGRVLVTGGTRVGNNGGADAVYAAELWNPATGTWTVGPNAARIRVYHSGALLLPNGAVLSAGGGTPGPVFNLNAEVYYPPYLFRAQAGAAVLATRPVLTGINALTHAPGANLVVELRDATTISRLVLVKAGTVTHSFNNGQRFIPLTFLQNGDLLQATLPASNNTLPPGHYLLAAIDAAGVPSHAVTLRITAGASTATSLPRNSTVLLQAGSTADGVVAVDAANLGVLQALGNTPDAATLARSQWTVRDGLADAACVSLELAAQPGRYLRHAGFRLQAGGQRRHRPVPQRRHLLPRGRPVGPRAEPAVEELPRPPAARPRRRAVDRPAGRRRRLCQQRQLPPAHGAGAGHAAAHVCAVAGRAGAGRHRRHGHGGLHAGAGGHGPQLQLALRRWHARHRLQRQQRGDTQLRPARRLHRDADRPQPGRADRQHQPAAGGGGGAGGRHAAQQQRAAARGAQRRTGPGVGGQPRRQQRGGGGCRHQCPGGRSGGGQLAAQPGTGRQRPGVGGEPRVGQHQRGRPRHAGGGAQHRVACGVAAARHRVLARRGQRLCQPRSDWPGAEARRRRRHRGQPGHRRHAAWAGAQRRRQPAARQPLHHRAAAR